MFQSRVTGAPGSPGPLVVQSAGDNRPGGEIVMIHLLRMVETTVLGMSMRPGTVTEVNNVQVRLKFLSILLST